MKIFSVFGSELFRCVSWHWSTWVSCVGQSKSTSTADTHEQNAVFCHLTFIFWHQTQKLVSNTERNYTDNRFLGQYDYIVCHKESVLGLEFGHLIIRGICIIVLLPTMMVHAYTVLRHTMVKLVEDIFRKCQGLLIFFIFSNVVEKLGLRYFFFRRYELRHFFTKNMHTYTLNIKWLDLYLCEWQSVWVVLSRHIYCNDVSGVGNMSYYVLYGGYLFMWCPSSVLSVLHLPHRLNPWAYHTGTMSPDSLTFYSIHTSHVTT